MVDYDFYVNTYLGSTVPEKAFPGCAARAEAVLAGYERCCKVNCPGPDSRAMAVCAMAEAVYEGQKADRISAATAGSVTVRYREDVSLSRELYRRAGIYLDICRGVG